MPKHFWGIISTARAEAGSENEANSCFSIATCMPTAHYKRRTETSGVSRVGLPLEAVRKSKVINQIIQGRGAVAVVVWCVPHLAYSSLLRAAKSETLFDCMGSISLCELQFGLINDILSVGDRSLAGLLEKSANWLLCCIIESRPL